MWILTNEDTLLNSDHLTRFRIYGALVYAQMSADVERGKSSGPTVASCQSEEEAREILGVLARMLAMKHPYLDIPECLKKGRKAREENMSP